MSEGDNATVDRDAVTLTRDCEHRVRLQVLRPFGDRPHPERGQILPLGRCVSKQMCSRDRRRCSRQSLPPNTQWPALPRFLPDVGKVVEATGVTAADMTLKALCPTLLTAATSNTYGVPFVSMGTTACVSPNR